MPATQREIRDVDPEIRRVVEWAGSTAVGTRRRPPAADDVRPGSEGSLVGAILGSVLSAAIFSAISQLVDTLSF